MLHREVSAMQPFHPVLQNNMLHQCSDDHRERVVSDICLDNAVMCLELTARERVLFS